MNKYTIRLSALSSKEVNVLARTSKEALDVAHKMYNDTDILEFYDSDVDGVIVEITDCKEVNPDDFDDADDNDDDNDDAD